MSEELFREYSEFIQACPTPYHFCAFARALLKSRGFVELRENEEPPKPLPKNGFWVRSERSLFAYRDKGHSQAVICVSHCDSPCFILKPNFEDKEGTYRKMRVANYGGGSWWTWIDRPLKMAGMVAYRTENGLEEKLFDSKKPIGVFPSTAVHFNAWSALTPKFDIEDHFCAICGTKRGLMEYVAEELGIKVEDICYANLRLMASEKPTLFEDGLFSAQQHDNMTNTFAILKALVDGDVDNDCIGAVAVFDNEEIGSLTKNGANGSWIQDCLRRVVGPDDYRVAKENSIIISADSTHGSHPNYPDKTEEHHVVVLGKGFVIELDLTGGTARHPLAQMALENAAGKVGGKMRQVIQYAAAKNLDAGGSTIGPMSEAHNGIPTVDIGIPVIGMHSIRELSSVVDLQSEIDVIKELFAHYSEHKVVYA